MSVTTIIVCFCMFAVCIVAISIRRGREGRAAETVLGRACEASGDLGFGLYRLLVIFVGHLSMAFVFSLYLSIFWVLQREPRAGDPLAMALVTLIIFIGCSYILVVTTVPIVLVAEARGYRSPLYYGLAWALAGLLGAWLVQRIPSPNGDLRRYLHLVLPLGGALGGLAYWWVAGRFTPARPKPVKPSHYPSAIPEFHRDFFRRP